MKKHEEMKAFLKKMGYEIAFSSSNYIIAIKPIQHQENEKEVLSKKLGINYELWTCISEVRGERKFSEYLSYPVYLKDRLMLSTIFEELEQDRLAVEQKLADEKREEENKNSKLVTLLEELGYTIYYATAYDLSHGTATFKTNEDLYIHVDFRDNEITEMYVADLNVWEDGVFCGNIFYSLKEIEPYIKALKLMEKHKCKLMKGE